ncbi:MAG: aminotransferase class V-fold PLP-dependent enzyme [Deltaproteobacteria bacterium]|nr:aminotransferase class V-fold PLP-dependent enzyme [Deltaproteobacteria bacterium]
MPIQTPIYLDYHATTPVDSRVLEAMLPYFFKKFGNASSKTHAFGWEAEAAVENARLQVASLLGAQKEEIYFTSGATESNNLAILGYARANRERRNHLLSCVSEHSAVLDPLRHLTEEGFEVSFLSIDSQGKINLEELQKNLRPETLLISLMGANNEIGSLHPLEDLGKIARQHGLAFHCDATQALGKIKIDVEKMGIDLLSLSGHKIYGPKGIGALYVRSKNPKINMSPVIFGGGHEGGLRSGTLNVPGIVGLGEACEIAQREMDSENIRLKSLRDMFWQQLQDKIEDVHLNGVLENRLTNNLNVRFDYVPVQQLMMEVRDLAFSAGATCTSVKAKPSHVLQALGLSKAEVEWSARFSLGRLTNEEEIAYATQRIKEGVDKIRTSSIEYEMAKEEL